MSLRGRSCSLPEATSCKLDIRDGIGKNKCHPRKDMGEKYAQKIKRTIGAITS